MLLPKLISWYRTQRVKTTSAPVAIRPIPRPVYRSLNIIFISALLFLISTLAQFGPENIFNTTSSRLQTSNDVLFKRLAVARGPDGLTEADNILKPKLASLDSRLLYLTYGPNVVTYCPFCVSDEPMTYLCYALPSILIPHLLHALALALATSSALAGKDVNRWRTTAAAIALGAALSECYMIGSFDWKSNARAHTTEQYVLFFWRMRFIRGIMIASLDAIVAACIYLSSTNRMFVVPPTSAERMETAIKTLENGRGKVNAMVIMRNAIVRDEKLRQRNEAYWRREGQVMGEVMDEREVVEGIRNALAERVQVGKIEDEARRYAEGITMSIMPETPHLDVPQG